MGTKVNSKGGFEDDLIVYHNALVTDLMLVASLIKNIKLESSFADMKGSANTDSANTDQAAAPTNGTAVAAAAAVSTTWTHGTITQPDVARNLCITIENPTGGPLNLFEGAMAFVVTGTLNGVAQTETITLTSTAGNKAVVAAKFRYLYGSKPFSTVTDITLVNVPDDALTIAAGLGSKIHIPNVLQTPDEADILKATVSAADYDVTSKVDTTNNTLNVGAIADNADVQIVYLSNGTSVIASGYLEKA